VCLIVFLDKILPERRSLLVNNCSSGLMELECHLLILFMLIKPINGFFATHSYCVEIRGFDIVVVCILVLVDVYVEHFDR